MTVGSDFLLTARVQAALDEHSGKAISQRYGAKSFLKAINELAERTRGRNGTPTAIDPEDVRSTVREPFIESDFLDIAVKAGLLLRADDTRDVRFRDESDRDAFAAGFIMQFLESDYMDRGLMRDRAVAALTRIGAPAVASLIEGLGHPDSAVRLGSSIALRDMKGGVVPALLNALQYGNEEVRRSVVGSLNSPEMSRLATDRLIHLLLNDPAPLVRAASASALEKGATPAGVQALVDALDDKEALVRSLVKDALERLDTPLAQRALRSQVASPHPSSAQADREWFPKPMMPSVKPPRIFLSYPREYEGDLDTVRNLLALAGFDVWKDSEGLLAGESWRDSLTDAMAGSDFVVAFLSKDSFDGYQVKELQEAATHMPRGRDPGIPFLLPCVVDEETWRFVRGNELPDFLERFHILRFQELETAWPRLLEAISSAATRAGFVVPVYLRAKAEINLDESSVNQMLIRRNFYDSRINNQGRAPYLAFGGLKPLHGGLLVHDVATQRIWTRDCANHKGSLVSAAIAARTYREEANKEKLGGFSDWRLPTIEEAMSLMTPRPREGGLHISEHFSDAEYVFTSDGFVASWHVLDPDDRVMSWFACYGLGSCQAVPSRAPAAVRLVRGIIPQ